MAETVARTSVRERLASQRAGLAVGIPLGIAAVLVAEAIALPAAWLPAEEAATVLRARGVDGFGGRETGPLYPFVLGPLASTLSATGFYELTRVLGALLWAAAFVPALAIARRCAPDPVAVPAAALAVLVPAAVYSTAVLPDAPAFLLAVSALALGLRYAEGGSVQVLAGALACALAAALARPWLAALSVAVALAAALPRVPWRTVVAWPYSATLAAAAASAYAVYHGLGAPALEDLFQAAVASAAVAAVGFGLVPWLVAWAMLDRLRARPVGVLLVTSAPLLALSAGFAATSAGHGVEERPLVVLSPLVFALAAGAWAGDRLRAGRVGAVALLTILGLAVAPASLDDPARAGAASISFAERVLGSSGALVALEVLSLVSAVLLVRRAAAAAAVLAAALVLAGQLGAWAEARSASQAAADAFPEPRDWVDRAAGRDARTTLVSTDPNGALGLLLWNRSVRDAVRIDPGRADPATGLLGPSPSPLVVAAPGLDLAGTPLAAGPGGQLLRVDGLLRRAFAIEGLYPDGWSTGDAYYRRFGEGGPPGTVEVTVSRKVWTGPDKPAQVVIVSRPVGGEAFAERITDIHSGQERVVSIPVPPAPFEIKVAVGPTFSPSEYGQPDTRQLGAQLRFDYRPG